MSDVDEQDVLAEMADAQREIDEVSLARIVIDKYGADSDKPSVKLAVAHLNGAHERDRLRSELKRADRYGSERFAEAVKIQTERDTALSALATVEAERDELRVKFEAVDQEMVDICRQRLEWMTERDAATLRAEAAEKRLANLMQYGIDKFVSDEVATERKRIAASVEAGIDLGEGIGTIGIQQRKRLAAAILGSAHNAKEGK